MYTCRFSLTPSNFQVEPKDHDPVGYMDGFVTLIFVCFMLSHFVILILALYVCVRLFIGSQENRLKC